jgi:hypothetical protein
MIVEEYSRKLIETLLDAVKKIDDLSNPETNSEKNTSEDVSPHENFRYLEDYMYGTINIQGKLIHPMISDSLSLLSKEFVAERLKSLKVFSDCGNPTVWEHSCFCLLLASSPRIGELALWYNVHAVFLGSIPMHMKTTEIFNTERTIYLAWLEALNIEPPNNEELAQVRRIHYVTTLLETQANSREVSSDGQQDSTRVIFYFYDCLIVDDKGNMMDNCTICLTILWTDKGCVGIEVYDSQQNRISKYTVSFIKSFQTHSSKDNFPINYLKTENIKRVVLEKTLLKNNVDGGKEALYNFYIRERVAE